MKQISWEEFELMSKKLSEKIIKNGFKPDYIIGITTGGLFPLALLAKYLKVKQILTFSASTSGKGENKKIKIIYSPKISLYNKKVLLVDEITESGITLKKIVEIINEKYKVGELKTATLGVNKDICIFYPNFYVFFEKGEWIKFPWEKDEVFGQYVK